MNNILAKLFWWRKTQEETDEEEFLEGWEGIPESQKERSKMTPSQLAISLSKCKKDSPAYILYEHELNLSIARAQSRPVYFSIIIAVLGIFLGWGLAQWKPLEADSPLKIIAEHIKKHEHTCTHSTKKP